MSWLDRKIEAKEAFHRLTYTLFFWKKINPTLSIYETEMIDHGKLKWHLLLLQPYLKIVALCVKECICTWDAIRLALSSSYEAKIEASSVVDGEGSISGKTRLVSTGVNSYLITSFRNDKSWVLNLSSSTIFLWRSKKLDILSSHTKHWKGSMPRPFVSTVSKYAKTGPKRPLFVPLTSGSWLKIPLQVS